MGNSRRSTGQRNRAELAVSRELQRLVLQDCAENAWARRLEDKVSRVVVATRVDAHTDSRGVLHCDYYVGDQLIFSDLSYEGKRMRTSFSIIGFQEGKRTDLEDGRSISFFVDGDNSYCVKKDRFGVSVSKGDAYGNWTPVQNNEKRNEILLLERMIFTPPHNLLRVA